MNPTLSTSMPIAEAMSRLGTETAFEVLARARALEAEGKDIVHLEIGEPDFDTPKHIIEEAHRALDQGYTHYGPSAGLPELREAIAAQVVRTRGVPTEAAQVVVVPGAKPIMFYGMMATLNPGDEVIYPNPGFPIYESVIKYLGAKPVALPMQESKDFRFDLKDLKERINERTRMIIVNSPQNPTGGVLTKDDIAGIVELVKGRSIWVLSDEIYSELVYDGEHTSLYGQPGMPEQSILLDGFSKTYAMTGWRLGYGVMPKDLAAHVARLATNCNSCVTSFVQRAGVAALTGPRHEVDAMKAEFHRRRDRIVAGLNAIPGVSCVMPHGAFYVFPNITKIGMKSEEMAARCLDEAGVAVLSGTAFGQHGQGYLRLSYANSIENIEKALQRLDVLCRKLQG
ncbi:MAG: pyridoxal phosphate-dependent aminotransferase [Candidatus Eisenbacteria bacterium]|nr:pyridoxal phosphate-dependent aminotransferase [Candidatus Eisenbacteria bacterium]